MKFTTAIIPALLLALTAACSSAPTQTSSPPDADATLTIRENQVLRLATGGSGHGTLIYKGWEYPFEVNNMALDGVGPGQVQFQGNVYNLDDVKKFEGTYKPVAANVDADGRTQGFWFENQNGVRANIITEGQEVTIRMDTTGSIVTLK